MPSSFFFRNVLLESRRKYQAEGISINELWQGTFYMSKTDEIFNLSFLQSNYSAGETIKIEAFSFEMNPFQSRRGYLVGKWWTSALFWGPEQRIQILIIREPSCFLCVCGLFLFWTEIGHITHTHTRHTGGWGWGGSKASWFLRSDTNTGRQVGWRAEAEHATHPLGYLRFFYCCIFLCRMFSDSLR